jgi:alkylation response protein AidB-like acyl-CoA dehydrogenase
MEHRVEVVEPFLQTPPRLGDAWASDRMLRETVAFLLGEEAFAAAEGPLAAMGRIATDPKTLALAARAEREPPEHIPYSTWGERIDEIRVSGAYLELGRIGVEAGVTALPYEDGPFGDRARIVWGALVTLWGTSSALYSCPVAMTDAAARTLLEQGDETDLPVVHRLTTRDWDEAWTSGQWMTETTGGSDVSRTQTVARRDGELWRLHGTKWFSSATTSEVALTLARPESSKELALFRIHRSLDDGARNAIVVRRLKDKLGTRALPTAELELRGAIAHPVGDPLQGGGVRKISTMLNITRIHNAIGAVGALARGIAWARAYAEVREAFGRLLKDMPAHRATLFELEVDHAAATVLTMRCCALLGKIEHATASEEETAILRGLTPVAKLSTARWAVAGTAEAMEAVGGVGYCEDSTIPTLVRNTHVLPIWEGTTNVLALDLLRAEARAGAFRALIADARRIVERIDHSAVADAVTLVKRALGELEDKSAAMGEDAERAQTAARSLAMGMAATYACALLCEQGAWGAARGDDRTAELAARLAQRGLVPAEPPNAL